jgi:hypothetical protein
MLAKVEAMCGASEFQSKRLEHWHPTQALSHQSKKGKIVSPCSSGCISAICASQSSGQFERFRKPLKDDATVALGSANEVMLPVGSVMP